MYCTKCGTKLNDIAVICPNCGCPTENYYKPLPKPQPAAQAAPLPAEQPAPPAGNAVADKPVQAQSQTGKQTAAGNSKTESKTNKATNGFATAGFILSLIGLFLSYFFCLMSVISLVFSIIGLNTSGKVHKGYAFSITGLILSIIGIIFWILMWIISISQSSNGIFFF